MRANTLAAASVAALAVAVGACGGSSESDGPQVPTPAPTPTKEQIIKKVQASVAQLSGRSVFGGTQSGTLFVIDAGKGLAITNNHVVEGAEALRANFGEKGRSAVSVIGRDRCKDLALVHIKDMPAGVAALPLGDSSKLETGASVFAAGFPAAPIRSNTTATVTSGTVTANNVNDAWLGRDINRAESLVQTDAAINHGNSGGPLVHNGQVIGVNTYSSEAQQGMNYAISSNVVKAALPELMKGEDGFGLLTVPARDVDIRALVYDAYGYRFWARYAARVVRRYGGMFVIGTVPGSPADKAGFEFGDWVTEMNGVTINSATKECDTQEGLDTGDTLKVRGYYLTSRSFLASLDKRFTRRLRLR